MQPILNIALRACRQATEYTNQYLDKIEQPHIDADTAAKHVEHLETNLFDVFFDAIKKAHPTHYVCKPGEVLTEKKDDSWHVHGFHSPESLINRLPFSAYSLVHKKQGKLQNAILINPINGDEYTASRGGGASLNGRRIRVSGEKNVANITLATNLLNKLKTTDSVHIPTDFLTDLTRACNRLLVSNCSGLDLALVAAGRIDTALIIDGDVTELEAALMICQEAGALSGTLGGGMFSKQDKHLIVGNAKIYKSLVQQFNAYDKKL